MESSNTGLDSINPTILTPDPFLITTTPVSKTSSESSRDAPTTPVNTSAVELGSTIFPASATSARLTTVSPTATTPATSTPGASLDGSSGSTLLPISRVSLSYVCRAQGCTAHFSQIRQLKHHTERNHRRMYACAIGDCKHVYRHPKNLREHKQTKHLKKRYQCDINGCNESVAHKKNLRRHKESKHGLFVSELMLIDEPPTHPLPSI